MHLMAPLVQAQAGTKPAAGEQVWRSVGLTNFYPRYGSANDQVDAVASIAPVQFQRVLPRYRLSTSETRDQGLGPMFADIPEVPSFSWRADRGSEAAAPRSSPIPAQAPAFREPWLGNWIDLLA